MLSPGDQLHHYVVEDRVGGGGMATVYRVRHAILGQPLALKVLDAKWVQRPDVRKRFLSEGKIMALVRHPAIVMVTDAVVDAPRNIAGLVMEYVEGPNLAEWIARLPGPPDADLVRQVLVPVLEAIHHAHIEGVIHRDLKPSNVLLSRDAAGVWHPRVVDFGIAHVLEEAARLTHVRVTDPYGRLGTPAFMSPEQIEGEPPTPASDVFSLGIVLYELATGGIHPFERDTDEATLAAIRTGSFPPARERVPGLDPAIEAAIEAALAVDPAKRAPDCAALLAILDRRTARLAPTAEQRAEPAADAEIPPTFLETTGPAHERRVWRIAGARSRIGREDVEVALGPVANLEQEHCLLTWDGGRWILEDTSAEGTRVNGARVTRMRLEDGDLVRVGHQLLKFHTRAPAAPEAPPPARAPAAPPALEGPRLEVPRALVGGVGGPLEVPITLDGLVIGKGKGVDLRLDEPMLAPRHCRIAIQGLDVVIEDLGSAVGTRVDGQSIRFRRLSDGARIQLGGAELRFRR